ncbi:MAG TPA: helix-turn-helix domain-containing protein, partial [Trinickia sp.]|nr:helix-turn-helix domain-containing protein [Trinickia sp.]
LTSSDRSVADIASSCGFSDASHLGREFRKQYGMPPVAFREQRTGSESEDKEYEAYFLASGAMS